MTLWFVLALMTAAAIFAVLWPLARRGASLRSGSDLAVYRDQLEEIRRDRAAGLIGESEAAAAQVEVSRRLIAAGDVEAAAPAAVAEAAVARRRKAVSLVALIVLPAGALALYLATGSPLMTGEPRTSTAASESSAITQLVAKVEAHLANNPNDGRGWEVIAPIYLRMGRIDDAVRARRNALASSEPTAERHANLGEALVIAANGVVTAEALAELKAALALDPQHVKARFFTGLAAEQDGRVDDAVTIWRALIEGAPPDAPWVELVRGELMRVTAGPNVGGGPNEDQIAAADDLPADQRMAMVKGMVERLAERLRKDGSDFEGWLRLVRSYMVLGERERAVAAAGEARRVFAGDPNRLKRIDELLKGLGLEG